MRILLIPRHRLGGRARAQALLEMALVVPLLTLLLVGVFEFGMVLYAHVQVSNAAREAARAASLYRSTRYLNMANKSNPPSCGSVDGWSIDQTVKQAIVYRPLDNQGCPTSSTSFNSTSLGWLDPNSAWTVTVTPAQSTSPASATIPTAGTTAVIKLRYPYALVILSNFTSYLTNPLWIEKSVEIEYQN